MSTLKEAIVVDHFVKTFGRKRYRLECRMALELLHAKLKKEDITPSNAGEFMHLLAKVTVLTHYLATDHDSEFAANRVSYTNLLEKVVVSYILDNGK